jgi:hypothetical protein
MATGSRSTKRPAMRAPARAPMSRGSPAATACCSPTARLSSTARCRRARSG